jgi:uncharacterized membrane protein
MSRAAVVLSVVLIYVAGLMMRLFVIEWLVQLGQQLLERTLVKYLQRPQRFRQLCVATSDRERVSSTCDWTMKFAGQLHHRNEPTQFQAEGDPPDRVAVYLPMSYQIGGFTLLLPRDLRPLPRASEAGAWC